MRPLTTEETEVLFRKLSNYTGTSLKALIAPIDGSPNSDRYVFRLHQNRCYYVRLSLANLATSISRDRLLSLGICLGKFTKTMKFRLHITALPILAQHARYKVWIKGRQGLHYYGRNFADFLFANGELPFLYGGHIVKAHVGRWSEDCPEHQGVVVYSMNDTPLGFGVTARSTQEARRLDPTGIAAFRQADCGEFLRDEDSLFSTT